MSVYAASVTNNDVRLTGESIQPHYDSTIRMKSVRAEDFAEAVVELGNALGIEVNIQVVYNKEI